MHTHIRRTVTAALLATVVVLSTAPARATAHHDTPDASVVVHWNTIAVRTITTENATPPPTSTLYYGFVSLAVHDAVATIEGRYAPYIRQPRPHGRASSEAAAATAAYHVLRHYFPNSAAALAADHAASLAAVPDGRAEDRGVAVGARAAANLVRSRAGDGVGDTGVVYDEAPAPGVWRPTPPANAVFLGPWLGFVRPLALRSPTQVRLPGPDPITSAEYARDFAEVRDHGALNSTARSPEQTATALFFNNNVVVQYQAAMRDQVTRRHYDIAAAARAFGLLGTAQADAAIGCWRYKFDAAYWRPITAIHLADTDGNPATAPDPAWTPLATTPPYPDYVSGHACVTGATSGVFGRLFGRWSIDLDLSGTVNGVVVTRHYATTAAWDAETMNARIWLGLHFRRAMTDGNRLGHRTADWVVDRYLRPTRR